ncbi:MAG: hydroxylamine reductase, partial [Firmicutes bacterium]|nr:hydroxylamine reductase [Bacillota bacterium]
MSMFCYQCHEAARGRCCDVRGVCGKTEEVAKLQDLLIYALKGLAEVVVAQNLPGKDLKTANRQLVRSLFMTITNANFNPDAIAVQVQKIITLRDSLKKALENSALHDAATFFADTRGEMLAKAGAVGVLATDNEDVRSLRELIIYGLKGMAAYTEHALNLGKEDPDIYAFIYEALAATLDDSLTADALVGLTLKTGEYGVKAMALLDAANTSRYGNPEITQVNIGVRNNPAILISGHDLTDLEQLLQQTEGTGVDVYTHSE